MTAARRLHQRRVAWTIMRALRASRSSTRARSLGATRARRRRGSSAFRAILSTINVGARSTSSDTATRSSLSLTGRHGDGSILSSDLMIPARVGRRTAVAPLSDFGRVVKTKSPLDADLDDLTAADLDGFARLVCVCGRRHRRKHAHPHLARVGGPRLRHRHRRDRPRRLLGNYSRDQEIVDTPVGCEEFIRQDDYAVTSSARSSLAWRSR